MARMNKKFTIIELLVVISIIMILASILLPSLNKAKQTSQRIQCVNNSKTLLCGMILYADSYQVFPYWFNGLSGAYPPGKFWYQKVYTMLSGDEGSNLAFYKNSEYYRCPAYRYTKAPSFPTIAYGYNSNLGTTAYVTRPERVKRPSVVIAIGDSDDDAYYGAILAGGTYLIGNRHAGRSSAAYVDGHAESVRSKDFLAPGVVYGNMDYDTGTTITQSTGSTSGTAFWPLELGRKWGTRGGGYDNLTK